MFFNWLSYFNNAVDDFRNSRVNLIFSLKTNKMWIFIPGLKMKINPRFNLQNQ